MYCKEIWLHFSHHNNIDFYKEKEKEKNDNDIKKILLVRSFVLDEEVRDNFVDYFILSFSVTVIFQYLLHSIW